MAAVLATLEKIQGAVEDAAERVEFREGDTAQIFGRDAKTCTQIITQKGTSRVHFEIKLKPCQKKQGGAEPQKYWRLCIKDKSTHGTFINGVRMDKKDEWRLLEKNDMIGLRKPGDSGYRGDFTVVYAEDLIVDQTRNRDTTMSPSPERRAGMDENPPVMPMVREFNVFLYLFN